MRILMKMVMLAMLVVLPALAHAALPEVPAVIGYHSAIFDEGGNPIQDGDWNVKFRITDAGGSVLYEEQQRLPAIGGQISALVGNGLTADGAPTGGVPMDILDPLGARYLEVAIDGMESIPFMELASVPYADYCQVALGAADSSVDYDALTSNAVDEIAKELTGGVGTEAIILREELDTIYSDPASATVIGVSSANIYNSSSNDLQNVLDDLDGAIRQNRQDMEECCEESVSNNGGTINGNLHVNGNISLHSGGTVDGYDVGNEIAILNQRTQDLPKVIWGSATGGVSPSIVGPNVGISYISTGTYGIALNDPMSGGEYAVVLTPRAGPVESSTLPRIYDKHAGGFTVQFHLGGTHNFDFVAIGN